MNDMNGRGWSIFFFWLNLGFAVWWTFGLVNVLVLAIHNRPFSWVTLLMDVFFSVLSIIFTTKYKALIWPK